MTNALVPAGRPVPLESCVTCPELRSSRVAILADHAGHNRFSSVQALADLVVLIDQRSASPRHHGCMGWYANQSKAAERSVAYMPMTRPVKPVATSVDR